MLFPTQLAQWFLRVQGFHRLSVQVDGADDVQGRVVDDLAVGMARRLDASKNQNTNLTPETLLMSRKSIKKIKPVKPIKPSKATRNERKTRERKERWLNRRLMG